MYRRAIVLLLGLVPIGILIFRDAPRDDVAYPVSIQVNYPKEATTSLALTSQTFVEVEQNEEPQPTTTVAETTVNVNTGTAADFGGVSEQLTSGAEESTPTKFEDSYPPE